MYVFMRIHEYALLVLYILSTLFFNAGHTLLNSFEDLQIEKHCCGLTHCGKDTNGQPYIHSPSFLTVMDTYTGGPQ